MKSSMKVLGMILAVSGFLFAPAHANDHAVLGGVPRVLDGDTLAFGKQRVRLNGIDAPESSQACYREANDARSAWACGRRPPRPSGKPLATAQRAVMLLDTDRYGRLIARCSVLHDGQLAGLGGAMVWNGWTLAYTQYSRAYVREQRDAEAARRGIWTSHWQSPAEYRRHNK